MTKKEIIEIAEQAGKAKGNFLMLDFLIQRRKELEVFYRKTKKLEHWIRLVEVKLLIRKFKALETKDEPVAWGIEKNGVILDVICPAEHDREEGEYTIPLYTKRKE